MQEQQQESKRAYTGRGSGIETALADSVLAQIDVIYENLQEASDKCFIIGNFSLTDEEKMVKPDYLLEPSFAGTLVSKSQKINALGILIIELGVRYLYGMPLEETKEVISKLALELNLFATTDFEMPLSERIKKEYETCKESGELAYFWQFHNAIMIETGYILAQNPELFHRNITEEQWQAEVKRTNEKNKAMRELAKYDEEMASADISFESAKQYIIANKDKFIAHRNALLQ